MRDYLDGGSWQLVGEFDRSRERQACRPPRAGEGAGAVQARRAKLVIAKLDRLSRNVAFLAALMDRGVDFVACDNPHANKLTCN